MAKDQSQHLATVSLEVTCPISQPALRRKPGLELRNANNSPERTDRRAAVVHKYLARTCLGLKTATSPIAQFLQRSRTQPTSYCAQEALRSPMAASDGFWIASQPRQVGRTSVIPRLKQLTHSLFAVSTYSVHYHLCYRVSSVIHSCTYARLQPTTPCVHSLQFV